MRIMSRGIFAYSSFSTVLYRSLAAYGYPNVIIDMYYQQRLGVKNLDYLLIWNYSDHLHSILVFKGKV